MASRGVRAAPGSAARGSSESVGGNCRGLEGGGRPAADKKQAEATAAVVGRSPAPMVTGGRTNNRRNGHCCLGVGTWSRRRPVAAERHAEAAAETRWGWRGAADDQQQRKRGRKPPRQRGAGARRSGRLEAEKRRRKLQGQRGGGARRRERARAARIPGSAAAERGGGVAPRLIGSCNNVGAVVSGGAR